MASDVERWEREQGRPATVERTRNTMEDVKEAIQRLQEQHSRVVNP